MEGIEEPNLANAMFSSLTFFHVLGAKVPDQSVPEASADVPIKICLLMYANCRVSCS